MSHVKSFIYEPTRGNSLFDAEFGMNRGFDSPRLQLLNASNLRINGVLDLLFS